MKKTVFAGTFDPFTKGHRAVVESALKLFGNVTVAIGEKSKSGVDAESRRFIAEESLGDLKNVEVDIFDGFLADYMKKNGISVLIRGIRNTVDFEYEKALGAVYKSMMPEMEICYLITGTEINNISSTFVREILSLNGDISAYIIDKASAEILKKYGVQHN